MHIVLRIIYQRKDTIIMTKHTLLLNRDYVIDFIKKNVEPTPFHSLKEELLDAVIKFVPTIGYYEEEDQKLSFKLSIGMNTNITELNGRFYCLHQCEYIDEDTDSIKDDLINMIKKSAALCTTDADIFIIQNENIIQCGIYYTDLEKTGYSEESLLNNNFVIFQNHKKNQIEMIGKNERVLICLDFENVSDYQTLSPTPSNAIENTTVYRTWRGIFEKVKKHVHGTICLFVKETWDPNTDSHFTDKIYPIDISVSRSEMATADRIYDFDNKVDILLSMLNYDGITIIDTAGVIRAYNVFCKNTDSNTNIVGGARHRAYNFLKSLSPIEHANYCAIYFQSQEGHIEFYDYSTPDITHAFFNPSIINGGYNNPFFDVVKKHINSTAVSDCEATLLRNNFEDYLTYIDITEHISELQNAHNGIDNFKNEPIPAENLYKVLCHPGNTNLIQSTPILTQNLFNTVINCIIGNSYGYSYDAQNSLNAIIDLFEVESWSYYYTNELYICQDLIWILSNIKLYNRWIEVCKKIANKYPSLQQCIFKYTHKDFVFMQRALEFIEYDT